MATKNKRRKFLVNPEFQLRFIAFVSVLCSISGIVFFVSNVIFFKRMRELGVTYHIPSNNAYYTFIDQQQRQINVLFLLSLLVMLFLSYTLGLLFSHRVAGALYRIKTFLNESNKKGPFTELKLRKNDFFVDVADALNAFMKK